MMEKLELLQKTNQAKRDVIKSVPDSQDAQINFRVDQGLKEQFELLCKRNRTTVSAELKRLMLNALKNGF